MPKWRIESGEVLSGEVAGEITSGNTIGHGIFDRDEDTIDFGIGCPFFDATTPHGFRTTDGASFILLGDQTVRVPLYVNGSSWRLHVALVARNGTVGGFAAEYKITTPWGDTNVVSVPANGIVQAVEMFKFFDINRGNTFILLEAKFRRLGTGSQAEFSSRFCMGNLWWEKP